MLWHMLFPCREYLMTGRRGRSATKRQPETKVPGLEEASQPLSGPAAERAERRVKLFKNGRSQAVRIPREFELPGKEAIMRKEGERLIIEPAPKRSLIELLDSLDPI